MATKFETAKAKAEILERVYNNILNLRDDMCHTWGQLGTEHQKKDWRTDELVWQDEEKTIPEMVPDYGNIEKTEEDYTESDRIQIKVLDDLLLYLEKQV